MCFRESTVPSQTQICPRCGYVTAESHRQEIRSTKKCHLIQRRPQGYESIESMQIKGKWKLFPQFPLIPLISGLSFVVKCYINNRENNKNCLFSESTEILVSLPTIIILPWFLYCPWLCCTHSKWWLTMWDLKVGQGMIHSGFSLKKVAWKLEGAQQLITGKYWRTCKIHKVVPNMISLYSSIFWNKGVLN